MDQLTGRRLSHEHMDDPAASREDLAEALRFIRAVNARLGGTRAAIKQFQRWSATWNRDETIRIIDIGTGSADIPLAIAHWAQEAQWRVHITAVDLHPTTVDLARQHIGDRSDITIIQADALKLMDHFQPGSFHYAHAGMFLHHLSDVQVMTVLRIMDRLAARGLIWNDLIRSAIGKIGARVLTVGLPAHLKHDAVVSVDAGFTKREALDLSRRAGLANPRWRNYMLHRFTVVCEKKAEN